MLFKQIKLFGQLLWLLFLSLLNDFFGIIKIAWK